MNVLSSLLLLLGVLGGLEAERAPEPIPEGQTSPAAEVSGLPRVHNYDEVVALASPVEQLDRRRWLRHRVRHRERVTQIAARYGVSSSKLIEWNKLDPQQPYPPRGRRTLKVLTKRIAPPRVKVEYVPGEDETWGDIATALRVEIPDLHAWNWRQRRVLAGRPMMAWADPAIPWSLQVNGGPMPVDVDIAAHGLSAGHPNKGRLIDGVQLPESPLYSRGIRRVLWGSSYTVENLLLAFGNFRHDTGFEHEIVVGSISKRGGRRLPPHKSHQSGRDVDIRLPLLAHIPHTDRPNADEIDWYASWALIKALGDTGAVSVIFLEADLHRRVYEAARVLGADRELLARYLIFPQWRPKAAPLVRHSSGHDEHIHVRFRCGPDEPRCRGR